MMMLAFALYDTKTGVYHPPFFLSHEAAAIRLVYDLGTDQKSPIARHPLDYHLHLIGAFDDQTGQLVSSGREGEMKSYGSVLAIATECNRQLEMFHARPTPESAVPDLFNNPAE